MKGMDDKKDYKDFTACKKLGKPKLTGADIAAAFQKAGNDPKTKQKDYQKALANYNLAVQEWSNGNKKSAGKFMDQALKDLAKSVGC